MYDEFSPVREQLGSSTGFRIIDLGWIVLCAHDHRGILTGVREDARSRKADDEKSCVDTTGDTLVRQRWRVTFATWSTWESRGDNRETLRLR